MTNKRLRIMILERDYQRRRSIEKMLNFLGYYRVVIMGSANEAFSVLNHAVEAFDLIIANRTLIATAPVQFNAFCKDHPLVRHLLAYDCPEPILTFDMTGSSEGARYASLSQPPDSHTIQRLMKIVEGQKLQEVSYNSTK